MADGYPTLRLQVDFEGQEFPWLHPIALNGRKVERICVDGVQVWPRRESNIEWMYREGEWFMQAVIDDLAIGMTMSYGIERKTVIHDWLLAECEEGDAQ